MKKYLTIEFTNKVVVVNMATITIAELNEFIKNKDIVNVYYN